jgi:hypothetical protein
VVLGLDIGSGQEFQARRSHSDAGTVGEPRRCGRQLVVDVQAVRRAVVDAPPRSVMVLKVGVPWRYVRVVHDDVVLGVTPDENRTPVEHEATAKKGSVLRLDHDDDRCAPPRVPGRRERGRPRWRVQDGVPVRLRRRVAWCHQEECYMGPAGRSLTRGPRVGTPWPVRA